MANAGPSDSVLAWSLQTAFLSSDERQHLDPSFGRETWQRTNLLGQGGFGEVWLETCTSGARSDQVRAVKQIRKSPQLLPHLGRELEVLVTFSTDANDPEHLQHFVQFLGWFGDDNHMYIALEFVPYGDLQQHIAQRPCSEEETALVVSQVAKALRCMHRMGFVHRDLKPANILVASPRPAWHVKLTDFGISKNVEGTELRTRVGTEAYMAPELFDRELASTGYTSAIDIWALGAVAYCARTGSGPFASVYDLVMFSTGKRRFEMAPLRSSSGAFVDFIFSLMDKMPTNRLTIDEVLEHEWLKSLGRVAQAEPRSALPQSNIWDAQASAAWNTSISLPPGQAEQAMRSNTIIREPEGQAMLSNTIIREPQGQAMRSNTIIRKPPGQAMRSSTLPRKPTPQDVATFIPYRPKDQTHSNSYPGSQAAAQPELSQYTPPAQYTQPPQYIAEQTTQRSFTPASQPYLQESKPFDKIPPSLRPGSHTFDSGYQGYEAPEPTHGGLFYPEVKPVDKPASSSRQTTQLLDSGYHGYEDPEPIRAEPSYPQSSTFDKSTSYANRPPTQHFDSGYHEQVNSKSFRDARPPSPIPPLLAQQPSSYFDSGYVPQQNSTIIDKRSPSPTGSTAIPWSEHLHMDPYRTCLTCGLWFGDRNVLFEHLEAEKHGVNTQTLEPEPYERPSWCRENAWVDGMPNEISPSSPEPESKELRLDHIDKDPRQCCLTCGKHFNRRDHLFRHIAAEQHGVDPRTFEAEPYDDYEEYEEDEEDEPSNTCLACGKSFWSRTKMFNHIRLKGHAR